MVGVEERREFRFRGYLYSQENTFPLVQHVMMFITMVYWLSDEILYTSDADTVAAVVHEILYTSDAK